MIDFSNWRHTFKLDPDKPIEEEQLERICESGTDAIIVGGTLGVTYDNTLELMSRVRRYAVPCVLEVSNLQAIVPGFDSYFVPIVLNAGNPNVIFAPHVAAIQSFGSYIPWEEIVAEGYLVCNPDSSVAEVTQAKQITSPEEARAYAHTATKLCRLPIFYVEYSGSFGEPEIVRACMRAMDGAHLFYGGGITSPSQAKEMAEIADTVVVGNIIYDDSNAALSTVEAVKNTNKK
ncbi:heptaprenylglyceryl phosphate synthase [Brevibacillus daliensis]|uniref:heptaprenylglyceryl phosphate synthase n=1 Tax=Brevibacillus daliensis TaxID=2892995 RepID=UPI001E3A8516|nr:heptaprenylglyceryl phosphate synthase [Brevibacillus daliensis]